MIRIECKRKPLSETAPEWLETDGRGGYASTTLSGCHTRRYHGLMVANLDKPEGRHVLLSKLEDSLLAAGDEHFLTTHRYPGLVLPLGEPPLEEFILDLFPRFVYRLGEIRLQKSILLFRGRELLLIRYDLEGTPGKASLRLKPFLAFRGYHELAHENLHLRTRTEQIESGFKTEPYAGMPPLFIRSSAPSSFTSSPLWYRNFEYTEERERGFDWHEDLFLPGTLDIPITEGRPVILAVSTAATEEDPAIVWEAEAARRQAECRGDEALAGRFFANGIENKPLCPHGPQQSESADRAGQAKGSVPPDNFCPSDKTRDNGDHFPLKNETQRDAGVTGGERGILLALIRAGRQFLIATPSGRPAVIAGYPWFGSWGRDALIALPGLAFCSGRIGEGIDILTELSRHERKGLLPNFFSGDGRPEAYNTVDGSLLYFRAIQELLKVTVDTELIRNRFWPVMKRIIDRFMTGTRFGIGMDENGLLHAGNEAMALTWMDATVGGTPVTPRHGCAVEINALWYNALCFTTELAKGFGDTGGAFTGLIPLVRRSFRETFWIPERGCLGDVFRKGALDTAIRPNQLFAVCLPHSPLDASQQAGVVRTVREHLLTPCGLRTLSPADPAYRGRYRGNGAERDGAYHQGTVWPWLLGPFGEAVLRVAADREAEKAFLRKYLRNFLGDHLAEAGIGTVSEVFDGDPPHLPGGCIAQAWSVAELIRLYTLLLEK